ncbi:MAG TPA: ABC transporter substrate-binding protein [Nevskiaceae bacterium]
MKTLASGVACFALCSAALATASAAGAAASPPAASDAPIPVTMIMPESGPLANYGQAVALAGQLAVKDINAHGGVLGRPLALSSLDSQSSTAHATVLARQVARSDAAVVVGGFLSSTREAIRPIFHRAKKLYVYTQLYEGGVCDKNMFGTGPVPYQQLGPALKYAAEHGLKRWYVMAANYDYGRISAGWIQRFAKDDGATIVGNTPKFFALSDSTFPDTVTDIQAAHADLIVALLVGAAQDNFFEQWSASGLNRSTTLLYPQYGAGAEQIALGGAGKGILAAWPWLPTERHPTAKSGFIAAWNASGTKDPITPLEISMWNAWHLWAIAVDKAGSLQRDKVIAALESGVSYDTVGGPIHMDGPTHEAITAMRLYRDNGNGYFDFVKLLSPDAQPVFMQSTCNLIKDPDTDKQFMPDFAH